MNRKRVLGILIGGGLVVGALGLWYIWAIVTKTEERGVSVTLREAPSDEEGERMLNDLNRIIDGEVFLETLVADCNLVEFYGASSAEEAKKMARDRSRVYFYTPKRLFIVHEAKRFQRSENDKIGQRLGELFREAAMGDDFKRDQ